MADRLQVLLSAYACEPGRGSEPEVGWQWAIHLARLHDVTVVTRANNRDRIERALAGLPGPHPRFLYFDLPPRWLTWKRRGLPVAVYYFAWQRAVARELAPRLAEFDLIHHITFNSFRQPGAWRACGRPIVLGPLGGGQICPWRLMGDFGAAWPGEMLRSLTVKLNGLNPFARRSFAAASLILCANEDTAARVPRVFRHKVRLLLETGIAEAGTPAQGTAAANGVRLIWVSRLVPIKGAPLAVRAFARARQEQPDLRLTLVGDGPDLAKVRALAARLGVATAIEWTGQVPLTEVKRLLTQHDVFLFTSLRDTSGNVLLEAMAAGLPAVTLRHHGAAQIATDETALRIPPTHAAETEQQLAAAMVRLARDPALRSRLGAAAAARIREQYLWPVKAAQMDALYREALAGARS
jgi:glycosyltransferase involved in cell wall biosynthesis